MKQDRQNMHRIDSSEKGERLCRKRCSYHLLRIYSAIRIFCQGLTGNIDYVCSEPLRTQALTCKPPAITASSHDTNGMTS